MAGFARSGGGRATTLKMVADLAPEQGLARRGRGAGRRRRVTHPCRMTGERPCASVSGNAPANPRWRRLRHAESGLMLNFGEPVGEGEAGGDCVACSLLKVVFNAPDFGARSVDQ